jgi:transposase
MAQIPSLSEVLARRRAALIVQVQCGQITATEAAAQLGVSRKTYYEWEKRALNAMVSALQDRSGGRPATPSDPEKTTLQEQKQDLQEQLQVLEQTLAIRQQLTELERSKKKP